MAMNPDKKKLLEDYMSNFKSCCRFLGVTDKDLYDTHLKKVVQKHWSFSVFKTTINMHPTCILNKDIKIHAAIDVLHQKMLVDIKNKISKYMEV